MYVCTFLIRLHMCTHSTYVNLVILSTKVAGYAEQAPNSSPALNDPEYHTVMHAILPVVCTDP